VPTPADEVVDSAYDNFVRFEQIANDYDKIRIGTGSQDNPARNCRELFEMFPDKKSGDYWVDPNEGSHLDAVLVECNATTRETCVYPRSNGLERYKWVGPGKDRYIRAYKEVLDEEYIPYAADIYQMKMMRLLSNSARQSITYNCKNSRAVVKFLTDNDLLMHSQAKPSMRPRILEDQCKQAKDGSWKKTIFEVQTERVEKLPIQDVEVYDVFDANEEFGLEIGPVCFS